MKRFLASLCASAAIALSAQGQVAPDARTITLGAERAGPECTGTLPSGAAFNYPSRAVYFVWNALTYPVTGSTGNSNRDDVAAQMETNVSSATGLRAGHSSVLLDGKKTRGDMLWLKTPDGETMLGPGVFTTVVETTRGLLVGTDGGERGGALVYVRYRGQAWTILSENIRAIFRIGGRLYAITGTAHLTLNEGALWRIDEAGKMPEAQRIADLPGGAPEAWAQVGNSAMLVATTGKAISIRPGGVIREIEAERACVPSESPAR